jgi:hypothetical protein
VLPVDPPPILSDVSGPSWLCFNVPTTETIPLPTMTAADLLDWSSWSLVVPPAAQVNGPTSIIIVGSSDDSASTTDPRSPSEPTALQTAIEFPYALFLAPAVYASGLPIYGFTTEFTSRAAPLVSSAGVVDLWSASLAGSSTDIIFEDNNAMYVPPVSAFWASDYAPPTLGALDATPEEYIVYGKPIPLQ